MRVRTNSGFTLIELLIVMAIVALLVTNVTMVMRTSSQAYKAGALMSDLEGQAEQTMDRITMAVMSSGSQEITPSQQAPSYTPRIDYAINLGVEDGELVWSAPERIELDPNSGQIVWSQNPDEPEERSVVWSNWASSFLEGEVLNLDDDNLNTIVDEEGLSFTKEGDKVIINLTLERSDSEGYRYLKTLTRRATCRN